MSHLIAQIDGKAGRLRLNRPEAIHALSHGMCSAMIEALVAWASDPAVRVVMIDHAEGRGFCAGGDVRALAESGTGDGEKARAFFHEEYRLNNLLFTYRKKTAAFMDGITMGGGVGIAMPCKFRIATENTRFAMPETAIGLFPDVGGGWYLPRLPGRVGQFLALTGARLDGAECHYLGIATHYIPHEALADVKEQIAARPERIAGILGKASVTPPPARIADNLVQLNKAFASDRFEEILATLEADDSDWASTELATLSAKSPQACKVSLRLLAQGAGMQSFADEMRQEYAVAARVVQRPDFAEGVRAVLIDKHNKPVWNPATPDEVTDQMLDTIFAPLAPDEEWTPLSA
jgi:enoyl-CoA hydratase